MDRVGYSPAQDGYHVTVLSMNHPAISFAILKDDDTDIALAVEMLRAGKLVAFPTETVYGLGADATNREAVLSIYTTKQRPANNPLIMHVSSLEMAQRYGDFSSAATELAHQYWPGPLTLVIPKKASAAVYNDGREEIATIAIRCPAHPVAQHLITGLGRPIVAPSANRSGKVSATSADHVISEFSDAPGNLAGVIDGGHCAVGIESTVVDCTHGNMRVLRIGSTIIDEISYDKNFSVSVSSASEVMPSPGMLESHYAPSLPVRLNVERLEEGEVLLGFGKDMAIIATNGLNLSPSGDLTEAAHHLYDYLRQLDSPQYKAIAVMPIPDEGVGMAINDRLRRAAAPRS